FGCPDTSGPSISVRHITVFWEVPGHDPRIFAAYSRTPVVRLRGRAPPTSGTGSRQSSAPAVVELRVALGHRGEHLAVGSQLGVIGAVLAAVEALGLTIRGLRPLHGDHARHEQGRELADALRDAPTELLVLDRGIAPIGSDIAEPVAGDEHVRANQRDAEEGVEGH